MFGFLYGYMPTGFRLDLFFQSSILFVNVITLSALRSDFSSDVALSGME